MDDSETFLSEWRSQIRHYYQNLEHEKEGIKAELASSNLSSLTSKRLRNHMQALAEQKKCLEKAISPLQVSEPKGPLALSRVMRVKLQFTQTLSSYYHNIHRDWGWGQIEEKRLAAEIVSNLSRSTSTTYRQVAV
jgi:hypothetical protein